MSTTVGPFDPETLPGVTFFDNASKRKMRHIYADADHWCAGWIVAQNPSGEWMTWRKATESDVQAVTAAIVKAHHGVSDAQ